MSEKMKTLKQPIYQDLLDFHTDADGKVHPQSVKLLTKKWLEQKRQEKKTEAIKQIHLKFGDPSYYHAQVTFATELLEELENK